MGGSRRLAAVALTFIAALPASSGCGASDTRTYRGNGFTLAYPGRWRLMAGIAPLSNAVLRAQRRFVGLDGQDWIVGLRAPDLPTAVVEGNVGPGTTSFHEQPYQGRRRHPPRSALRISVAPYFPRPASRAGRQRGSVGWKTLLVGRSIRSAMGWCDRLRTRRGPATARAAVLSAAIAMALLGSGLAGCREGSPSTETFHGGGFSFRYPASWHRIAASPVVRDSNGFTRAVPLGVSFSNWVAAVKGPAPGVVDAGNVRELVSYYRGYYDRYTRALGGGVFEQPHLVPSPLPGTLAIRTRIGAVRSLAMVLKPLRPGEPRFDATRLYLFRGATEYLISCQTRRGVPAPVLRDIAHGCELAQKTLRGSR